MQLQCSWQIHVVDGNRSVTYSPILASIFVDHTNIGSVNSSFYQLLAHEWWRLELYLVWHCVDEAQCKQAGEWGHS